MSVVSDMPPITTSWVSASIAKPRVVIQPVKATLPPSRMTHFAPGRSFAASPSASEHVNWKLRAVSPPRGAQTGI